VCESRTFDTIPEAAVRTGYSVNTIKRMIAAGTIPVVRSSDSPKAHMRILVADLLALPKTSTAPTQTGDAS
jgi:excisionase family DNA binding protein